MGSIKNTSFHNFCSTESVMYTGDEDLVNSLLFDAEVTHSLYEGPHSLYEGWKAEVRDGMSSDKLASR